MLQQHIDSLENYSLKLLFIECEDFSDNGILESNALLRRILKEKGFSDDYQNLRIMATCVYRALAKRYVRKIEIDKHSNERY